MTATADLRSEHVGVGRMLGIMDAMAVGLRAGRAPAADDLAQSIEFLRVFVDACHHTKEEQLLFPAVRTAGITSAEEVIAVLLADHVKGRETVARIGAAAQRLAGDESVAAELADAMGEYTALLHAHIRREENDCFDAADRELPVPVQAELAEGYELVESDVVGEGRHAAFHVLLERLSQEYRS